MGAPLELLYQLRTIDTVTDLWGSRFFTSPLLTNQAAATHEHTPLQVPRDKSLFVTKVGFIMIPTAAVAVSHADLVFMDESDTTQMQRLIRIYPVHDIGSVDPWSHDWDADFVLVGGSQFLSAHLFFDAGNVSNVSQWYVWGYEVAKGNVVLR